MTSLGSLLNEMGEYTDGGTKTRNLNWFHYDYQNVGTPHFNSKLTLNAKNEHVLPAKFLTII